jgi:hypothetical protein
MFGRWVLIGAVLLSTGIAGCGGAPPRKTSKVTGTIKYKSAPLTRGTIVFQPPSGQPAFSTISENGTYTLDAVIGPNTVTVESREDPPPSPTAAPVTGKSLIPEKYSHALQSNLKADVKDQETNTFDFDLNLCIASST